MEPPLGPRLMSARDHAAAFRQRRKEEGWRKLSFYLPPAEVDTLARLRALYGSQEAAVRAALQRLAAECPEPTSSSAVMSITS